MSHNKRPGQADMDEQRRRKRTRWSKQHLYLVLDDWDKGLSIHKMDPDCFDDDDYSSSSDSDSDSDSDDDGIHHHQHLLETPLLRFESPAAAGKDQSYLAASGTKMFIIMSNDNDQQQRSSLVYDAGTGVLSVGTPAPPQMTFGFGVCMPVGDVLYLLSYRQLFDADGHHSFEAMSWSPAADRGGGGGGGGWAWKTLPAPPPTFTASQFVVSHAVHPDGCTIFMTTADRGVFGSLLGTYSFNTREEKWRWHGEWALPFKGQAHFDAELGAWVGLHHVDGYVCSCPVIVSPDDSAASALPPRKFNPVVDHPTKVAHLDHRITQEKLFGDKGCAMTRPSLSYVGAAGGRYCLVECVASKVPRRRPFDDKDGCVIHVTTFGLKYNHEGELQTRNHRSTRSFQVSRHRFYFAPFVFWA